MSDRPEYVMSYDDARRLASQLGISLDGLNGDDYAMCHQRFERFVRPVETAVALGIVDRQEPDTTFCYCAGYNGKCHEWGADQCKTYFAEPRLNPIPSYAAVKS